jgi:hypothetical protein
MQPKALPRPQRGLLSQPTRPALPPVRRSRRCLAVRAFLQQQQPQQQAAPPVSREPEPGGVVTTSGCVAMAVDQPAYKVQIAYCSTGRPLESCDLIYAHAGHSGWLDKCGSDAAARERRLASCSGAALQSPACVCRDRVGGGATRLCRRYQSAVPFSSGQSSPPSGVLSRLHQRVDPTTPGRTSS